LEDREFVEDKKHILLIY